MSADPMARAREMLAAEYARNEMNGEAAYLREGSTASLDERCAVNVIAALLTKETEVPSNSKGPREAEIRGEERERLRELFMLASTRIERDVRLSELTDDEIDFLVSAIRDGATGGDGKKAVEERDKFMRLYDSARGDVEQLRHEVAKKDRALHARNVALDGMAWVWCNGGCEGGVFRFSDAELTDEMLAMIVRNTERLTTWAKNRDYRKTPAVRGGD